MQKKEMTNNKDKNTKDKIINSLVDWMEDLEDASLNELREIRKELGHSPEDDEAEFLTILRNEYQNLGVELKSESSNEINPDSDIKPYLGYVSDETGLTPSKIEQEVGYSTDFLILVTENPEVVKETVRDEITDKTLLSFPQLKREKVLCSLKRKSTKIAAARDSEYSYEEITFEKILESSGMDEKQQKHLLELNKGGK